jgi:hypothetical protein
MKWKPLNTRRKCQAFNDDGKRCRCKAMWTGTIFVDRTVHPEQVYCVKVELCSFHASNR